jgi:hypothetical protein
MTTLSIVLRGTQLRRTSRLTKHIERVLAAMGAGRSLHLQHHGGRRCQTVPAAAVAIVTRNEAVAPAGDTLFPDFCPAQTWRIIQ